MIVQILIFLLISIIGYTYLCQKRLEDYFKSRDVKMLPGWPLFGNFIKSMLSQHHFLYDIFDVYKSFPEERYVGIVESTTPILLIRDPDLIKQITVTDFSYFVDRREFFSPEQDPLFGCSLLMLKGQKWREMRTTMNPGFTSLKMKQMVPLMRDTSLKVVEYLQKLMVKTPNGKLIHDFKIDNEFRRYTNDVFMSTAFGLYVDSINDRINKFYESAQIIANFTTWQRICSLLIWELPRLSKLLHLQPFPKKIYRYFKNLILNTMEYRKKNRIEKPDLIQTLMEAAEGWSDDDLVGQPFMFFFAGFEATASVVTMTIHELTLHPDIQDKLYQEVRESHYKEKDQELTYDLVVGLKYLDMVVCETLRKWSPGLLMDRVCTKPYTLPPAHAGGKPYRVEPGDIIYNSINSIHMDEKYYPEPDRFDPERFSDENKKNIKPFSFLPFGFGPRKCIGYRFALLEIKIMLYNFILNFEVHKCSKTTDPTRIQPLDLNIKAVGDTWITLKART